MQLQPARFQLVLWALLVLLEGPGALAAEGPNAKGARVYRRLCAKCHGPNGEGVKDKYAEALHGDWSIEKLTRYIDKSMPEDAPRKCVGADAAAVARYIHEAFYSREAQARNHPARVELVRLTNRQYVNAVADLLARRGGDGASPAGEPGLKAVYYRSTDFRRDTKFVERVDARVDFDFTRSGPGPEPLGTNALSAQWRGSLMAEETGEHEIVLKSANGVRLWLNDDEEPLVDAWVASGEMGEHRATVRLIGGRSYPLRLDFFRFKEKTIALSLQWKPPRGAQVPIPARQLSTARVDATFVVTTPFPPDDSSVGYERGVSVSRAWDEATTQAAIEVAGYVAKHLDRLSRSRREDTNRLARVESFAEEFVAAAFRRPLDAGLKRVFVEDVLRGPPKLEDGVKRMVLLALKSPRFLYLGLTAQPDSYEVSARLAFGLWDSVPDRELTSLAAQGALTTREQVVAQARRMLNDPRARSKVRAFLHHWLQIDHVEDLAKDPALYPDFSPELIGDLRSSLNLFLDDVVWGPGSDYRRLLLEPGLFTNDRLGRFYGVGTNLTEDFTKVSLDPGLRSGVLTHPYLLAAFSYPKSTSPIHRGVFLTRNIMGRTLKPPPMAVAFKDADFATNLTMREKVAELTRPQACQTCHAVINPLGFSLEHYDAVGRYRTQEGSRPIDAVSEYVTDDGKTVRLAGPRDLAEFAIGSEAAQRGFIEQLFHQVAKQPVLAYGPAVPDQLRDVFVKSEFNLQTLLVETATVSALHGLTPAVTASTKR